MNTWTKDKRTGDFAVIGLAEDLQAGRTVEVHKKDGTSSNVQLVKVGKSFTAKFGKHEGEQVAIATVAPRRFGGSNGGSSGATKRCWECGCAFTYAECKRNDGDWQDGYCGC